MSNNVNIIFGQSKDPLTDKDGNLIGSCPAALDSSSAEVNYDASGNYDPSGNRYDRGHDFTPLSSYKVPLTWTEIVILVVLKIVFIIVFAYSDDLGWTLVYVGSLVFFIIFLYLAITFDFSYHHLVKVSNEHENPWYILITFIANVLFYAAMYLCGISIFENKKLIIILTELCIWVSFFYFIIADAYRYLLHKHLLLDIANAFGIGLKPKTVPIPCNKPVTATNNATPLPVDKDEVFNIAGNNLSYKEARAVCKAFGAKLANYEQIEKAYEDGAEWVNYGWSEGQYAYFPLQKETWMKMEENHPESANGKVRPGISGGYFANPELKFGANCFGKKPKPRHNDLRNILPGAPAKTAADIELDKKVEYYKKNSNIYSFNSDRWYSDPNKKDA